MNEEQKFLTNLALLGKLCGFLVDSSIAEIYDKSLSDIGYTKLNQVVGKLITSRKAQDRFPSIRDIRDLCEPDKVSIDVAAQEALSMAINAVSRFGYYDPEGAKKFLGPEIWDALPGRDGWREFCVAGDERMGGLPIAIARSQLRDRIKAKLSIKNPDGRIQLQKPNVIELRNRISFIEGAE